MLSSPDYRLKDLIAVLLNGTRKNQSLDKEMMQVDLTSDLQNIEVPYIMIQGQDDLLAPDLGDKHINIVANIKGYFAFGIPIFSA